MFSAASPPREVRHLNRHTVTMNPSLRKKKVKMVFHQENILITKSKHSSTDKLFLTLTCSLDSSELKIWILNKRVYYHLGDLKLQG